MTGYRHYALLQEFENTDLDVAVKAIIVVASTGCMLLMLHYGTPSRQLFVSLSRIFVFDITYRQEIKKIVDRDLSFAKS